jgi:hypothetical protein
MNPHADRDASEQPSDRTAAPDAGTTREQEERVERYAEALRYSRGLIRREKARAVMAVADAEQETLRAEVERLRSSLASTTRWAENLRGWIDRAEAAEAERDEIAGRLSALLCELTSGRLSKTTYDVPTMVAEIDSVYDDAHQEDRAERDRLAGIVEQVRALADRDNFGRWVRPLLHAILDGAHTPQATRQTRDVAAGAPGSASEGTETGEVLEGAQGGEERCSTCGQGFDTPPCCKTPDSIGGHTSGGGCQAPTEGNGGAS